MAENSLDKSFDKSVTYFFFVSVSILIFRLLSTFLLAFKYAQSYEIKLFKGFLPVIVFASENNVFTKINTYSIFFTTAVVFFIFAIIYLIERRKIGRCKKAVLWFFGVISAIFQYIVALFLNRYTQFSTSREVEIPLIVIFVAVVFMMVFCMIMVHRRKEQGNLS